MGLEMSNNSVLFALVETYTFFQTEAKEVAFRWRANFIFVNLIKAYSLHIYIQSKNKHFSEILQ
jgi:hypothetical protein